MPAQVKDGDAELASVEVCAELGIDRSTLVRWVKAGKLTPTRKLPGRTGAFLFRRSDVEAIAARAGAA